MLSEGKPIHLKKGDTFTFYENEPSISTIGLQVILKLMLFLTFMILFNF